MAPAAFDISTKLERTASAYISDNLFVLPLESEQGLVWVDAAGYTVGRSEKPNGWPSEPSRFEFALSVPSRSVVGHLYRPHVAQ
jgi:hypothetical protein